MKQRYTITIADMEINVISDESPETVESLVGSVDRKMREVLTVSRRCSKSEAALLCALDYCSDKVQALRKVKQQEALIDTHNTEMQALRKENDRLRIELETLRESLLAAQTQRKEDALTEAEPAEAPATAEPEEAPSTDEPEQITLDVAVEELKAEDTAEAVSEPAPSEIPDSPAPEEKAPVEPEDIEFDPSEIFRRVKANRTSRKGGKRK